jgi:hypothetical protein
MFISEEAEFIYANLKKLQKNLRMCFSKGGDVKVIHRM